MVFFQRFLVTQLLTLFLLVEVAEAAALGAVGRCPAALRALIPG
jgi:hypothetical protein